MKKLSLLIFGLFLSHLLLAQSWSGNGTDLYFTFGDVGIGTSNPL